MFSVNILMAYTYIDYTYRPLSLICNKFYAFAPLNGFLVAWINIPRNTAARIIPTGYATVVPRFRHSDAQKKYVIETALMNVAGTAVIQ